MCVLVCACEYKCPWRRAEGIRCPGDGVTGGCKLPDMAGVHTPNLGPMQKQYLLFTSGLSPVHFDLFYTEWRRIENIRKLQIKINFIQSSSSPQIISSPQSCPSPCSEIDWISQALLQNWGLNKASQGLMKQHNLYPGESSELQKTSNNKTPNFLLVYWRQHILKVCEREKKKNVGQTTRFCQR